MSRLPLPGPPALTIPFDGDYDPLQRFYTPRWAIRPLTCTLGRRLKGTRAWEPCSGGGAIVRELEPWCSQVYATDLDPDARADVVGVNFLEMTLDDLPFHPHWIITNPGYHIAAECVRHALTLCDRVAMLLRLSFLESCRNRRDILSEVTLTDLLEVGRIPFEGPAGELAKRTEQSSDQVASAWFVWDGRAPHDNTQILHFPDIKPKRAA